MSANRKHFWHSGSRAVSVCSLDSLSILIEALKVRSGSSADERLDFRDLSVVRSRNGEPGKKFCLNVIKVHFVPPRPRFLFSTFALVGESKRRMRGAKNTCFPFPEFNRTKDEENNLSRLEENEITVFNYLMRSVLFSISGCSNHLERKVLVLDITRDLRLRLFKGNQGPRSIRRFPAKPPPPQTLCAPCFSFRRKKIAATACSRGASGKSKTELSPKRRGETFAVFRLPAPRGLSTVTNE